MENVPYLAWDATFGSSLQAIWHKYDLAWSKVCYADYGAATARNRLILVGFRRKRQNRAHLFFARLQEYRKPPVPVRDALAPLSGLTSLEDPDHVWIEPKTIGKYEQKYQSGKYGWYRLDPDKPAPSFGNLSKTYVLHPFATGGTPRVLSIREAMTIAGFPLSFRFPPEMSKADRYQMVADAVSPVFSEVCGRIIRELLE